MDNMKSQPRHPDEDQLIDFADGLLDESTQVVEHLETCASCQRRIKALQDSLALTRSIWEENLTRIQDIQPTRTRRFPWKGMPAAAACVLLGLGLFWASYHLTVSNEGAAPVPSLEQIDRDITQATVAAELLAATDLIAKYPDTKTLVQSQYRHIVEGCPHTSAAQDAKLLIE